MARVGLGDHGIARRNRRGYVAADDSAVGQWKVGRWENDGRPEAKARREDVLDRVDHRHPAGLFPSALRGLPQLFERAGGSTSASQGETHRPVSARAAATSSARWASSRAAKRSRKAAVHSAGSRARSADGATAASSARLPSAQPLTGQTTAPAVPGGVDGPKRGRGRGGLTAADD